MHSALARSGMAFECSFTKIQDVTSQGLANKNARPVKSHLRLFDLGIQRYFFPRHCPIPQPASSISFLHAECDVAGAPVLVSFGTSLHVQTRSFPRRRESNTSGDWIHKLFHSPQEYLKGSNLGWSCTSTAFETGGDCSLGPFADSRPPSRSAQTDPQNCSVLVFRPSVRQLSGKC
jgi:hypothetical protein